MPRLSKIGAAALAAFGWTSGSAVTATYLVVAGGGGGGKYYGGGGGAGGYRTGTASLNPTLSYTVTVGGGGAGAPSIGSGTSGNDSVFSTITSTGGGFGNGSSSGAANGGSGGSGGGGGGTGSGSGGAGNTPSTSPSQGSSGGSGSGNGGSGGGGASAAGGGGGNPNAGAGGAGTASSISGSSVTYAGGGGGSASNLGAGGSGGGGAGANDSVAAISGTANLGGGGGGGSGPQAAGAGGSGVVIISYPGAQQFGGGNVTSVGGNTIHTFTTSGTLVPATPLTAQYLIVAGGGGGGGVYNGAGGGGAAGGLLTGTGVTIDTNSNYVVAVGAGGAGGIANNPGPGVAGSNSSWSMVSTAAVGGGYGGDRSGNGGVGGSGGGSGIQSGPGSAGTSGQGNAGGQGRDYPSPTGLTGMAGGGGGAGAAGANGAASSGGGGGVGLSNSITGSAVFYAGGGAGGAYGVNFSTTGGNGGGGAGGKKDGGTVAATAGTANTGGGGGGGGTTAAADTMAGAQGGSGIVIIAYPGSTQQMAGGTVTISGGNVIHTFTSSGYLTPIKYASRSLRFRSSANAFLSRTPAAASNRTTWTWSGWVKRGTLTADQTFFEAQNGSTFNRSGIDGNLNFYCNGGTSNVSTTFNVASSAVIRDPSSWYHFVISFNTTQATAANRLRLYINGVQVTAFASSSYPSQNSTWSWNAVCTHNIGRYVDSVYGAGGYFDGYLTEINFVDGAALTPSSFGTFNSYGVWQPITYGGSYGTNGFYLTFGNNTSTTTLGYDTSPQGNNWTTNNISVTAGVTYDSMTDVPTLTSATAANYCVMNPLAKNGTAGTFSNANLSITVGADSSNVGTFGVSAGKFYFEVTLTAATETTAIVGIVDPRFTQVIFTNAGTYIGYGYTGTANKGSNGSYSAYGATYTVNDIIGVAFDADAGTLTFYKNNTSQGTAYTGISGTYVPVVGNGNSGSTKGYVVNFGQRPFTYTPPSGFVALNTYNLSTPTIPNGAVYMAATTYTGTGATQSIANTVNGTNFQPDWVWVKGRSGATDHAWYDVLRGTTKQLESNTTTAETTEATGLTAFGSTGFTVGALAQMNTSAATYVAWQWKANGAGVSNTSGTITSTVSANTTAGFAVVTYTGTGSAATIGHGLGVAPSMMITKNRTSGAQAWHCYHASLGNSAVIFLNTTAAQSTGSADWWNNTTPTSSVFSVGTGGATNGNTQAIVAYCFAAVAGFSAFGSYTGNGSTDGPFVYTGFRPRFVMVKCSSNSTSSTVWAMWDTSRSPYNASVNELYANLSAAEGVDSSGIDILSNGFKPKRNSEYANLSGWTYIYMAFAENPFKYSNAR